MTSRLHQVDTRNPKEIVIEGLRTKIEELGALAVPFVLTMEYPSKETFLRKREGDEVAERRIIVERPSSDVEQYPIGFISAANGEYPDADIYQGWVDGVTIRISIWTTASDDRDNIVELIKIWMLELEQGIYDGQIPFFYEHGIQAVRYLSSSESVNMDIIQNGVMYIGTLTYHLVATFFNEVAKEDLVDYKVNLIGRIKDCIKNPDDEGYIVFDTREP